MNVTMAYLGRSRLEKGVLSFAPNLSRDPVSFSGGLKHPIRFREAISALHDIVINDLRFKPRDRSAYHTWKQQEASQLAAIRAAAYQEAKKEILQKQEAVSPDLEARYKKARQRYWKLRDKYSNLLRHEDPNLWRLLLPLDPVVTVADDVVFFECFSADESSYGCLTAKRDEAFDVGRDVQYGTTNVDYSWALYDQFQALRSYRDTRLHVDPEGFEVRTEGNADYREEKIELPSGWLRGFMQVQGAMGLPMQRVTLTREAVYSMIAWYKRNKARKSPRAMRFELQSGAEPRIILEPWEKEIVSHGTNYDGPTCDPIRIWGVRRLQVLARTLPLAERFHVYLLGTGLPSFWVADMGEMKLTLGLSGWTANDWTRGSALDSLAPPSAPTEEFIQRVANEVRSKKAVHLKQLQANLVADAPELVTSLRTLAQSGQVIFDLNAEVYRWRQIMPMPVAREQLGDEHPEVTRAREIPRSKIKIVQQESVSITNMRITAQVEKQDVQLVMNADGLIQKGDCQCDYHRQAGIRNGPCCHLLAVRQKILDMNNNHDEAWYQSLLRWSGN